VKKARLITGWIGLAVFVALGRPRAQAQSEIAPDHSDQ
jgi:hypothetical protein